VFVKELWRYPVKSLAGEQIAESRVDQLGIAGDRQIMVRNGRGRVLTSRTHHHLLGLKGTLDGHGGARISGYAWDSPEALRLVRRAAGPDAEVFRDESAERFDVLPLLIATDGAIAHMGFDGRRLRPNIVIGGVAGLEERTWPGRRLRIGDAVINVAQLRGRCVMTTYDPDTLKQDLNILRSIASELGGTMALDCAVESEGLIRVGEPVLLQR
jgi:MOSC domain-containing protein